MAYITYSEYVSIYGESPVAEEEFPVYAELASDVIDSVTGYKVKRAGLSSLPPLIQELVRKATAAQIMYTAQNGIETTMSGQFGQGFAVGKVRVDGGSGNLNAKQRIVAPVVTMYLEQSGLMERSVPCLDQYRDSFLGTW